MLKKEILNSFFAGILVSIGGMVYLSCQNKIVGAFLFSVALLCICYENFFLYTGKICYLSENFNKKYITALVVGLLGNLASASTCAIILSKSHIQLQCVAQNMCILKINKSISATLIDSLFCGILIYLSVNMYKKFKSPIAIFLCIPVFILCGFEHCIADIFYFTFSSNIISVKSISFIFLTIMGNTFGGMLIPLIKQSNIFKDG